MVLLVHQVLMVLAVVVAVLVTSLAQTPICAQVVMVVMVLSSSNMLTNTNITQ
jgi:hypothetical protein